MRHPYRTFRRLAFGVGICALLGAGCGSQPASRTVQNVPVTAPTPALQQDRQSHIQGLRQMGQERAKMMHQLHKQ
jgi:hypothetical protein